WEAKTFYVNRGTPPTDHVHLGKVQRNHGTPAHAYACAYAWHISPMPFPELKVPRICVDISQLPTHMRDPLPPSKASIKVTPRICASRHAYAWPITFMCSSAFQEQ
ncbi:hypothetical protein PIB30_113090, partial [Stylosanthes scabra]|nr:hypothetical protein [Stylosanthes scabra]